MSLLESTQVVGKQLPSSPLPDKDQYTGTKESQSQSIIDNKYPRQKTTSNHMTAIPEDIKNAANLLGNDLVIAYGLSHVDQHAADHITA